MNHRESIDVEILDVRYFRSNDKYPFLNIDLLIPNQRFWKNSVDQLTGNALDWRNLIARGLSATTDLQGTNYEVHSVDARMGFSLVNGANLPPSHPDHSTTIEKVSGGLIDLGLPTLSSNTSYVTAEEQAAEHFLRSARNALSSFQGGVFVAELGKAIHGIQHPAESLVKYLQDHVRDAKRLRKRFSRLNTRRLNKVISDLWLERQYAWLPLCSDLESAGNALAELSDLKESQMASGEGYDDWAYDVPGRHDETRLSIQYSYAIRQHEVSKVRFYGKVSAYNGEQPGSFLSFATKKLGLDLSNALPTAWELIPFSFVADYFSNLGSMISAYSFPTAAITWMNRGMIRECSIFSIDAKVYQVPSSSFQTYEYQDVNVGSYKATIKSFLRTGFNPGNLLPSLRLTVPGIAGWAKWLNLTALANSIRQ